MVESGCGAVAVALGELVQERRCARNECDAVFHLLGVTSHQWGISAAWSSVACQHSASFVVHDPPKPILAPVRLFQAREEISMRFDVSVAGNMHREMIA